MKKVKALLMACFALAFPLSVFAVNTTATEVVIESGVTSMTCQNPC